MSIQSKTYSSSSMVALKSHTQNLKSLGYTVLRGAFSRRAVSEARDITLSHQHLLKNTRPTPSAGHIAGFHHFPELEDLHASLSCHASVHEVLMAAVDGDGLRTIGLSDITVNRSQQWHNDLLRGKYREHLSDEVCWGDQGGGVFKALLYLQESSSLKIIPGSHLNPIRLDNDIYSEPNDETAIVPVSVDAGDVILMDIRLSHRGSTEEQMAAPTLSKKPKILVSTVLGAVNRGLTKAMEIGNFYRHLEWTEKYS